MMEAEGRTESLGTRAENTCFDGRVSDCLFGWVRHASGNYTASQLFFSYFWIKKHLTSAGTASHSLWYGATEVAMSTTC